jgi:hypothetical protein
VAQKLGLCQCTMPTPDGTCPELATQEDLLCNFCRNYHRLIEASPGEWVAPPCHEGL